MEGKEQEGGMRVHVEEAEGGLSGRKGGEERERGRRNWWRRGRKMGEEEKKGERGGGVLGG